jgi:hypothetical protein
MGWPNEMCMTKMHYMPYGCPVCGNKYASVLKRRCCWCKAEILHGDWDTTLYPDENTGYPIIKDS